METLSMSGKEPKRLEVFRIVSGGCGSLHPRLFTGRRYAAANMGGYAAAIMYRRYVAAIMGRCTAMLVFGIGCPLRIPEGFRPLAGG